MKADRFQMLRRRQARRLPPLSPGPRPWHPYHHKPAMLDSAALKVRHDSGTNSAELKCSHRRVMQLRRHPDRGVKGAESVVSARALDDLEEQPASDRHGVEVEELTAPRVAVVEYPEFQ